MAPGARLPPLRIAQFEDAAAGDLSKGISFSPGVVSTPNELFGENNESATPQLLKIIDIRCRLSFYFLYQKKLVVLK